MTPNFSIAFKYDEWRLGRLYITGIIVSFGWEDNNSENAKSWFVNKEKKFGVDVVNIELVHIKPWR